MRVLSALVHGGTSTAYAIGRQPDGAAWKVAVTSPANEERPLAVVELENESLSVSARWGRSFAANGVTYGHVIDARTGAPAEGALLSAVILPGATESDALSTALLIDPGLMKSFIAARPKIRCVVARGPEKAMTIVAHAIPCGESF